MIKKVILILSLLASSLFADMKNEDISKKIVDSGITIIDIRTEPEWKETGVIKNSILITFFDENGNYNTENFLKQLDKHVSKDKAFAIVCRTGSRTSMVGDFLAKEGYNVINLKGGILSLSYKGYALQSYKK